MRREVIKVKNDNREVTPITYFLSVIIATLTGSTFSMMMIKTYDLYVSGMDIVMSSLIFSIIITIFMTRKRRIFTILCMAGVPLLIAFFFWRNSWHLREALASFLATIENMTLRDFNLDIRITNQGRHGIPQLIILYNLLIILITCFVIVHRKTSLLTLIAVAPYLVLTIAITYNQPGSITSLFGLFTLIILIFADRIRLSKRENAEVILSLIFVPLLVFAVVICLIFPHKTYKNDRYAIKTLRQTRRLVAKTLSDEKIRTPIQNFLSTIELGRTPDEKTGINLGSGLLGGLSRSEDLNMVGEIDIPEYKLGSLTITRNSELDSTDNLTCNFVYLRNKSMDYYFNNTWTTEDYRFIAIDPNEMLEEDQKAIEELPEDQFSYFIIESHEYDDGNEKYTTTYMSPISNDDPRIETNNVLSVGTYDPFDLGGEIEDGTIIKRLSDSPDIDTSWDYDLNDLNYNSSAESGFSDPEYTVSLSDMLAAACVPYYTDGYLNPDGKSSQFNNALLNPFEHIQYLSSSSRYNYVFSKTPTTKEDIFPKDYITEYVNGVCLQVPSATRQAIIDSGALPDWYMDLLNGTTEMQDYEKVRAVCDYVRSLHPYDEFTPYPSDDMDFVVWFITESETGFCVHYATTAVILLRMLGVPCRYASGYLVNEITLGHPKDIMSTDAHAWIEFYMPEFGWVMDDPTPGNQTAASMYNIDAIAAKYPGYGSELPQRQDQAFKPSFTVPDVSTDVTVAPEDDGSTIKQNIEDHRLTLIIFLCVVFFVTAALLIIRMIYVMYWKKQFTDEDINMRARAYYKYFRMILHKLDTRPDNKMLETAQVATFSNRKLTDSELDDMLATGKAMTLELRKQCGLRKKLLVDILSVDI